MKNSITIVASAVVVAILVTVGIVGMAVAAAAIQDDPRGTRSNGSGVELRWGGGGRLEPVPLRTD
jgi:hypothetical protein